MKCPYDKNKDCTDKCKHAMTCIQRKEKKEVRNKAIDDFAETCKQDVMCQTFGLHPRNIDEIAEQLKGGGVDA